jgi:hypothetical protein
MAYFVATFYYVCKNFIKLYMPQIIAPDNSLENFCGHYSILEKVGQDRGFILYCFISILL